MVIIGGLGSIYGSFLGATLITLMPELLRTFQDYDIIVYGLLLVLMTMFMPGGLVRVFESIGTFIFSAFAAKEKGNA
jgi:branched-chain amino acid transport system permease protein